MSCIEENEAHFLDHLPTAFGFSSDKKMKICFLTNLEVGSGITAVEQILKSLGIIITFFYALTEYVF